MSYLPIAILGYLLNSVTMLVDKALINKSVPSPAVYTFYLGTLSLMALLLIPFGFYIPSIQTAFFAMLSGLCFVAAWIAFFNALKYDEATRISPLVGTITPVFTLIIGVFFLSQNVTPKQFIAILVLIAGMATISSTHWFKSKLALEHLSLVIAAGFFFAISSLFLREAFVRSNFITGLVVSRSAMGIFSLGFLLVPHIRAQILKSRISKDHFANKTTLVLILGQICGAWGGLLITYAISLVNPAIVSSLHGIQYIFLLLGVLMLSKKYRHLLEEDSNKKSWIHKIAGSVIIGFGLAMLAFNT